MFIHKHPYKPFIPIGTTKLIVGTLPPPRFSTGNLKSGDVDFCYGSSDGQLWRILDRIFNLNLVYETTDFAIAQRHSFLRANYIGICDMVASAERDKIDASDIGMKRIVLRDLIKYITLCTTIETLLFTGGNSKNGPEYLFRKHLKTYGLELHLVNDDTPRIHHFTLGKRLIKTVSLTAPSGSANRAVGSNHLYKKMKAMNPDFNTIDYRVLQYKPFFTGEFE